MIKKCPTCGQDLPAKFRLNQILKNNGFTEKQQSTMAMGALIAEHLPPGSTYEHKTPARNADLISDVAVPFSQSCITAFVGFISGYLIGDLVTGSVISGVTFCATWTALLIDHRKALWSIESITGLDIDNDGHVGEPETKRVRFENVQKDETGKVYHIDYIELPKSVNDLELLKRIAHALLIDGVNLSRNGLSDMLSQTQYKTFVDALIKSGLAINLPGNKRELTGMGRFMLRELLN